MELRGVRGGRRREPRWEGDRPPRAGWWRRVLAFGGRSRRRVYSLGARSSSMRSHCGCKGCVAAGPSSWAAAAAGAGLEAAAAQAVVHICDTILTTP